MPQDFTTGQVLTAAQMDTLSGAVDGYATTATAAGTTTFTTASLYQQFFTGSTTQTVVMPVASTLYVGQKFRVVNNSSGVVTVQSSGANTIYAVPAGGDVMFTCILASGISAASWDYKDYKAAAASSSGLTFISSTAFTGVASVSLPTGSFTSTYENYKAIVTFGAAGPAGNPAISLRMRDAGTDNSTANYYYMLQKLNTTPTRNDAGAAAATSIPLMPGLVSNALTQGGLEITILKPKAGTYPIINVAGMLRDNTLGFNSIVGTGIFLAAGTFDSMSLFLSSDTFAGTIRLYGYQNS